MDLHRFGLSDDDLTHLGYRVRENEAAVSPEAVVEDRRTERVATPRDPARRTWAWTVALLAVLGWSASSFRRPPDPVPANRSATLFSSSRAMALLVEIAREPRPTGSPEADRVRAYVEARLHALGLEPEVQATTYYRREGDALTAVAVHNVVARVPGTASTGAVLLSAHYDSAPLSAGAGDDAVGVSAVLEAVRAVLAGPPLRNDLVVLFTDGERLDQAGARAFVAGHPWMADVRASIVAEMSGVSGPSLGLERQPDNGAMVTALAASGARPATSSLLRVLSRHLDGPSDLDVFEEAGVSSVSFTALGGRAVHLQAADRAERVSERTLQHEGGQILAATRALGGSDLARPAPRGGARAYVSLPLVGLVPYPTDWALPVGGALIGAWLVTLLLFRWAGGSLRRVLAGAAAGLVTVAASTGAGFALRALLRSSHDEYGSLSTAVYHEGIHLTALWALTVAVVVGAYALARPRCGSAALFIGGLTVPLALATGLALRDPFLAPAVQLPLAVALLTAVFVALVPPRARRGRWAWIGFLAAAAAVLMVVVPALELTAAVMTLRAAPLLAGLAASALLLLLPTFEWLLRPRRWWAPALALGITAAALALGSPRLAGGHRHPEQTSLVYLVDDTLEADALGSDAGPARRVLGWWLTVAGPGEAWSRSWVAGPAVSRASTGALLLSTPERWEVAGGGPPSEIAPPGVRVVASVADGERRHLRLAIRSGLGGEMLGVHLLDGVDASVTAVDAWTPGPGGALGPVTTMAYWGRPERGEIAVGVDVAAGAEQLELEIIEHHLRPAAVLGPSYFQRADSLIPDADTGSDRVVRRTLVRLPLGQRRTHSALDPRVARAGGQRPGGAVRRPRRATSGTSGR